MARHHGLGAISARSRRDLGAISHHRPLVLAADRAHDHYVVRGGRASDDEGGEEEGVGRHVAANKDNELQM